LQILLSNCHTIACWLSNPSLRDSAMPMGWLPGWINSSLAINEGSLTCYGYYMRCWIEKSADRNARSNCGIAFFQSCKELACSGSHNYSSV
jgi:hypothetical protein